MVQAETKTLNAWYGKAPVLQNIDFQAKKNHITSLIGPSGCGKSTFLRMFNRMNDFTSAFHFEGEVLINQENIYRSDLQVEALRKNVGIVFQKPNPFPKSIFDNLAFGLKIHGDKTKSEIEAEVENALKQANLWDEVKDKLKRSALELSGGQQQKLCIARTLAVSPELILMDEPTSALDPISMAKIEELMLELKQNYTIIMVTHNLQQAKRISDDTAFFQAGNLVEQQSTAVLFTNPIDNRTQNFISGRG